MRRLQDFDNEYLFVLPRAVLRNYTFSPIIDNLYVTDLGFFPNAENHYVTRVNGASGWVIIFCTGGRGTVQVAGNAYQLHQYSLIIMPPNVQHIYYAADGDPWDIYWLHFEGKLAKEFIDVLDRNRQRTDPVFVEQLPEPLINPLMRQFWQMIRAFIPGFTYRGVFFVSQMLGAMLAELSQLKTLNEPETKGSSYVDLAMHYIYQHLDQPIKVAEIATTLNISTSYLSRIFRQTVGMSVNAFVTSTKMKQASHYLQYTNVPIQQIAGRLGYTDSYYFSRVFKKTFRVSPRQYRQRLTDQLRRKLD